MKDPSATEIRTILEDPLGYNWSIQGFGMLRLYLTTDEIWRLHIWNQDLAVEDVSTVHDHPWDLDSRIISGVLGNQRFTNEGHADQSLGQAMDPDTQLWHAVLIRTGEGGHPLEEPQPWMLTPQPYELYYPGDTYHQDAPEIHESIPHPGTVTVVRRTFSRKRDIATSLYKDTPEWVSAEPRPATPEEIMHFTTVALERWNG